MTRIALLFFCRSLLLLAAATGYAADINRE